MWVNAISHYLPKKRVDNFFFEEKVGLSNEWLTTRTGIKERAIAEKEENSNTMAIEAIKKLESPYSLKEVDLIIAGTYTPHDTIATIAHYIQDFLNISDIPVISISTACSSFINGLEIAQGYFALGKAKKALIVTSDKNSAYSDFLDKNSGHLWGDGAAAVLVSAEKLTDEDIKVEDVTSGGAANMGKGTGAVGLKPTEGGTFMEHGRDVFNYACKYMESSTRSIVKNNGLDLQDIHYVIPHQANQRIISKVGEALGLPGDRLISEIETMGNTGCASSVIAWSINKSKMAKGNKFVVTVFGGGYSYGSALFSCQ